MQINKYLILTVVSFVLGILYEMIGYFKNDSTIFSSVAFVIILCGALLYKLESCEPRVNYLNLILLRVLFFVVYFSILPTTISNKFDMRSKNYILLDDGVSHIYEDSDGSTHSSSDWSYKYYIKSTDKIKIIKIDNNKYLKKSQNNKWLFFTPSDKDGHYVHTSYTHEEDVAILNGYIKDHGVRKLNKLTLGWAVLKEYILKRGIYNLIFILILFLILKKREGIIFRKQI